MKILQIHKYYSRKRGGGSLTAFFELIDLLRKKGQKVLVFSMQDPNNKPSEYEKYFIENFDINETRSWQQKIKLFFKIIWNRDAQKKLSKLLEAEKPDIAHVHNIYHYLTPAILHTLKKYKIPIVFKLSDYKALCPNYKLFIKGRVCEKCKGRKYYHCLSNKCLKDSYLASFTGMVEAYVHYFLGSYKKVDLFLTPSEFMKNKCLEFGIPENKLAVLRNTVDPNNYFATNFKEESYFLYYGRISEEKGIKDLIQAVKKLAEGNVLNGNQLLIVGQGPQENELKNIVSQLGLQDSIKFPGFKQGTELKKIIAEAKFIVLPSIWYDNSPLVISESQLFRKPVIISDLGGSPEMILKDSSGYVFKAGDVDDLANKIKGMLSLSQAERIKMGSMGHDNIKELNDPEKYYQKLISLYQNLIEKNK